MIPTETSSRKGNHKLDQLQPVNGEEENLEAMSGAVSHGEPDEFNVRSPRDAELDEKRITGHCSRIGDHGILAVSRGRENVAKVWWQLWWVRILG